MRREKNTEPVRLYLNDSLKCDLKSLAASKGFESLSAYIRYVLRHHAYGHCAPQRDLLAESVRDE